MTAVSTLPGGLFDGRDGGRAPFKADYVSSLVSKNLDADYEQILRRKALGESNSVVSDAFVTTLLQGLKDAGKSGKLPKVFDETKYKSQDLKIGIIGGGIAGLYAAYILELLKIPYEILEANPKRMGGRIYTHYFSEPRQPRDYYDIGAMRFPNSPIMARTFDLFDRLDMGKPGTPTGARDVLIPYYMIGRQCPTRYNDITTRLGQNEYPRIIDPETGRETQQDPDLPPITDDDPFRVSTKYGGPVPATRVSHKITAEILDDAYDRFRQKIKTAHKLTEEAKVVKSDEEKAKLCDNDRAKVEREEEAKVKNAAEARQRAYEYLMRHDKYSLREYLQGVEGYDPETVHWLETIDSATGWYDQAFTENVMESLAFSYSDASNQKGKESEKEEATKWWCINGGTEVTVDRLLEKVNKERIFQGRVVKKISLQDQHEPHVPSIHPVEVITGGSGSLDAEEKHHYSAVINTTTLGALQKIDLTDMELPFGMKSAIRILRYDTSTKVGIKFKKMWWKYPPYNINLGGVAKTDLPIRVCVYPSYNLGEYDSEEGVLLASYTWGQDSERVAAHVSNNSPHGDDGLKELMIYNLARLHTTSREEGETKKDYEKRFNETKRVISENWIMHHAWDWSKDKYASGAFALFSPGQFSTLIPHLIRPASDGRFVIAGEHASANHAWIVGALDSSLRALKQIFTRFRLDDALKVMTEGGEVDGEMVKGFGDVEELKQEQVAKQVIISMLTEEQMDELKVGRPIQAVAQVQQT